MPKEKLVRVVREIEYVGPESWIERILANSVITEKNAGWLTHPKTIRQISISRSAMRED